MWYFFLLYKCWCEYFATLNPGSISMRDWHIHLTIVGSTKFVSKFCPMTKSICGWFYQLPRNELKEFSFKLIEGKHFFFTITRLICLVLCGDKICFDVVICEFGLHSAFPTSTFCVSHGYCSRTFLNEGPRQCFKIGYYSQTHKSHPNTDFNINLHRFQYKFRPHSTIHTFKKYFAIVFSTISFQFSAISSIQIDPSSIVLRLFIDYV